MTESQRLSRRTWGGKPGLGLSGLLVMGACATNPLTGKSDLAVIPEDQEIEYGRQGSVEVAATMGIYDNPALTAYVDRLGKALAAKSERPHLPWSFQVADDPMVNAMALPGGPIFVTRGLLTHLSSEAQLVAVLGHEVGHVTGRHAVRQISKSMVFVLGNEIGKELWKGWSDVEGLLNPAVGLLMLRYSRDDEREADDLGYRYTVGNGYEVREAPGVFQMFKQVATADGGEETPLWLSSHPESEARADHFAQRIAETPPPIGIVGRDEFLAITDGLVYGADPRQGFFEGGVFKHPRRKFQVKPPPGWNAMVGERALIATMAEGASGLKLGENPEGGTPAEALEKYLAQDGVTKGEAFTLGAAFPHTGARFTRKDEEGNDTAGAVIFFVHGGALMKAAFIATPDQLATVEAAFRASLATFTTLTEPATLAVEPARLKIVTVAQPMTLAEFARQHPAVPAERLSIMNHVGLNAPLTAGQKIKVVEGKLRDDQIKTKS
ncbi:MAG TPA: M48 family metalloprotease [Polyangia bacterium]